MVKHMPFLKKMAICTSIVLISFIIFIALFGYTFGAMGGLSIGCIIAYVFYDMNTAGFEERQERRAKTKARKDAEQERLNRIYREEREKERARQDERDDYY